MHGDGHRLEGGHELGGGRHHRLLLAANNLLDLFFSPSYQLQALSQQVGTSASQIAYQKTDKGQHQVASADNGVAEVQAAEQPVIGQLLLQLTFDFRRFEDRRSVHHENEGRRFSLLAEIALEVVAQIERHAPSFCEARHNGRQQVQVTGDGAQQLPQAVPLGGRHHSGWPVGGHQLTQGLLGSGLLLAEFSSKLGGQVLLIEGQTAGF